VDAEDPHQAGEQRQNQHAPETGQIGHRGGNQADEEAGEADAGGSDAAPGQSEPENDGEEQRDDGAEAVRQERRNDIRHLDDDVLLDAEVVDAHGDQADQDGDEQAGAAQVRGVDRSHGTGDPVRTHGSAGGGQEEADAGVDGAGHRLEAESLGVVIAQLDDEPDGQEVHGQVVDAVEVGIDGAVGGEPAEVGRDDGADLEDRADHDDAHGSHEGGLNRVDGFVGADLLSPVLQLLHEG